VSGAEVEGLPEVLRRLAEVLPERFRLKKWITHSDGVPWHHTTSYEHKGSDWWQFAHWDEHNGFSIRLYGYADLERACREEVQARGWFLEQFSVDGRHDATISRAYDPADPDSDCRLSGNPRTGGYDTPAHALALAVLQALS
jgi:hypothetical protein